MAAWTKIAVAIIALVGTVFATLYGQKVIQQVIQIPVNVSVNSPPAPAPAPPSSDRVSELEGQVIAATKRAEQAEKAQQETRESFKQNVDRLEGEVRRLTQKPEAKIAEKEAPPRVAAGGQRDERSASREKPPSAVEQDDLLFQIMGCRRSGDKVSCAIQITNRGTKRLDFSLYQTGYSGDGSYLLDNVGNQYRSIAVRLGAHRDDGYLKSVYFNEQLEPNLPIRAELTAVNVSLDAQDISAVLVYTAGTRKNNAVLRNIGLTK
jgi:hypothetical protein